MKAILKLFFLSLIIVSCSKPKEETFRLTPFEIKGVNIRAIEAIDENTMWFAGSNGNVGYTENAGKTWNIDSISYDTLSPEFRALAVTKDAIFVLSLASPALLYKTIDKGENWELVYKEDDPAAF